MKALVEFLSKNRQVQAVVGTLADYPLETFFSNFNINPRQVVSMEQVHGDKVAIIDKFQQAIVAEVDGLLTQKPNVHLVVRTADCVPILLAEPSGWVGAVHAGRAGTQLKVLQKALQLLQEQGGDLSLTRLFFGPAISVKNYEINPHTHEHFDLIQENSLQALLSGVVPENIFRSNICTFEDPNYPSYRRNATKQRFFSAIAWNGAKI
jgi:YfiH family protein